MNRPDRTIASVKKKKRCFRIHAKGALLLLAMALPLTARAAVYDFNGTAGDGQWNTAANWTVTDSAYTWPNEQFGNEYTNEDCQQINITTGQAVTRAGGLSIDGVRDGSATAVLTLDNASTLNIGTDGSANMWIADWSGSNGTVNVLGGSTLNANGIEVGNEGPGVGTMIVTGATVNANDDFILGKHAGSVGRLIINPGSTINVADRWYNNDNGGSGFDTRVTQNGGTVNIGYRLYGPSQ
jgi:hypothetical protein